MKRSVCKDSVRAETYIKILWLLIFLFTISTNVYAQSLIPGANSSSDNNSVNMDVPTPTVASLGKYGDVPLSYYTGNPNISIPLYELKTRDISMPITLDYDASGVMVNNLPSWAGQNWTLNIGGVITRSRRGAIDEKELSDYLVRRDIVHNSYFKNHGKIREVVDDASNNYKKLKDLFGNEKVSWDMSPDIFTFHFLGKSGKFFLGNDGEWKVISNDNLEILFDCDDDNNYSLSLFERMPSLTIREYQKRSIAGFIIRDDEGNTYRFGYNKDATEYTTNIWRMSKDEHDESWYANSWYLTSVKDRFGNTLMEFSYERGAYIIQMFNYFAYMKHIVKWPGYEGELGPNQSSDFPYTASINSPVYLKRVTGGGMTIRLHSSYVPDEMATEKLYEGFYSYYGITDKNIENINWDNFYSRYFKHRIAYFNEVNYSCVGNFFYIQGYGRTKGPEVFNSTVKAEYDKMLNTIKKCRYDRDYTDDPDKMDILRYSRIRKLDSLTITGNGGSVGFVFQHGYHKKRMYLENLILTGKNQSTHGEYKFKYNKPDQMPSDYLTNAVDYWGHYNGKGYKMSELFNVNIAFSNPESILLFSKVYVHDDIDVVDCSPDSQYASLGSLTEIQYPTGGTTTFEYECGDYNICMSNDRQRLLTSQRNYIGGGLRIKSIKNYDSSNHSSLLSERTFDYKIPDSEKSSGILFVYPKNRWKFNVKCEDTRVSWRTELSQTTSAVPLSNMSGTSLGYTYVTETCNDFKNDKSQKTIYHYSSLSDEHARDQEAVVHFAEEWTPYDNFTEMEFMRGKILDKNMYDEDGRLIHSTKYEYRKDDFLKENFSFTSNMYIESRDAAPHFNGGVAKIYHARYDLAKKTETTYIYDTGGTPMEMSTITQYNNQDVHYTSDYPYTHKNDVRLLLSEDVICGTMNERTVYDYRHFPIGISLSTNSNEYENADFENNWGNDERSFEWYLYNKMFCLKPSVTSYYKNGNLLHRTRNVYRKFNNIAGESIVVTNKIITEYPTGDNKIVAEFIEYDSTGRPIIFKASGQPTTYMLWGGANNNLLMIKSCSPINLTSGSLPVWNENTCLTKTLKYISISNAATGYIYGPLFKVSKVISSNQNITTYIYDDMYRLEGVYDNDKQPLESYEYNYRK